MSSESASRRLAMYSAAAKRLRRVGEDRRPQHARDRGLLDHLAIIAAVQAGQQIADRARLLDDPLQVGAGAFVARKRAEHRVVEPGIGEVVLQRVLVLQVLLGFAARDFVERRLRDVDVAAVDQLAHLAIEERQQQRADVRAVDVRVGHDDDLVIARLVDVEFIRADAGAERHDQRADLLGRQHLVELHALHVQDLAAQRQHRLERAVAPHLGGAAGRVALDDQQLGLGGIALLAVGELARQRGDVVALLARELPRLAGGFARGGGFHHLADDHLAPRTGVPRTRRSARR